MHQWWIIADGDMIIWSHYHTWHTCALCEDFIMFFSFFLSFFHSRRLVTFREDYYILSYLYMFVAYVLVSWKSSSRQRILGLYRVQ